MERPTEPEGPNRERRISPGRRAEDLLRQNEARTIAYMSAAIDGIVSIDHRGEILEFNPAAETMFGVRASEVVGRRMAEVLIPERHRRSHQEAMTRFLETGETSILGRRIAITALRADGTEFPVELTVTRLPAGGPPVFSAFVRDVSETRNLEDQLRQSQKMEAVGKLAGGIAHDFNNLLTVILGYTHQMIERFPEGDPSRKDAEAMREAAERAASLTQQLLAFSRRQVMRPVLFDLNEAVGRLEAMLRPLLGPGIHLTTELDAEPARILADPAQIEQVIVNLAVNARDAMPEGGRLSVRTSRLDLERDAPGGHAPMKAGRYVSLVVEDTGIGIDEATQARIFEPFFTTKDVGKATGLGLSTVYGIVRQTGGYVFVKSLKGEGSTFTVCLPRAKA